MSHEKTRQFIEWIGMTAVVISVVFLALQVRQANQIARAETSRETITLFNEFHDAAVSEPTVFNLLVKLAAPSPELTPGEVVQTRHLAIRFVNAYLAVEDAYFEGLVPREMYEGYRASLAVYVEVYPSLAAAMRAEAEGLTGGPRELLSPLFAGG